VTQAARASRALAVAGYHETLSDFAGPILESAARFAGEVLSPLNSIGDRSPCSLQGDKVVTPPGFVAAYQRFREDGWVSLGAPAEYGGQGLPLLLAGAVTELWGGANLSFAMCPELAVGALEVLRAHAAPEIIKEYAPRIASGEWACAMCLTEPQAGSDLSLLTTTAEPSGKGWELFGRKIFISWGDHDLTDNIVHFVLARTPGAPSGIKGLSLFLVPKKLPDAGEPLNHIKVLSLEHKMGIRASPTCVMELGGEHGGRGWLLGELHAGISCLFTMMNHMRLGVGLHAVGLAERALQLSRAHAQERVQGRSAEGRQTAIIQHADVRRMLLQMKALTHAARSMAYMGAASLDVARAAQDEGERNAALARAELLTPVVKAWCSEVAVEVASLGVQVHGGTGFIDDAEISQVYRDARIGPIFEGTNYIQAQDLLSRKVLRDQGAALQGLLAEIEGAAYELPADPGLPLARLRAGLLDEVARLRAATAELLQRAGTERELVGATAYHFLHWLGVLAGAWQWALAARSALELADARSRAIADTAVFYAMHVLPRTGAHEAAVRSGASAITEALISEL
jgi:acyl-CoA dehydrogenase